MPIWRLGLGPGDPLRCDGPIQPRLVLTNRRQNLHGFQAVSERDRTSLSQGSLHIPIEGDARHRGAVPIPERAIAKPPRRVVAVLVGRIETERDQRMTLGGATVENADRRRQRRRRRPHARQGRLPKPPDRWSASPKTASACP